MSTRRLLRSFAVALVLLVLLDLALRMPSYPSGFPDDFRIPKDTLMEYDAFTDWIAERPSVRVAVLGDSVIEGHVVDRDQTLPARMSGIYEAAGRDVGVYNLALRAAHANDLFGVAADLTSSDAVDLLVVQFNYMYYGNETRLTEHYPEIFSKIEDLEPFDRDELRALGVTFPDLPDRGTVEREVASVWRLYRERDHIDAVTLGGRPADAIERAVLDFGREAADLPGARQLLPEELDPENLEHYFGGGRYTPDNPNVEFLRLLVRKAVHDGVPIVVFNNPVYFDGIAYWDALDREVYEDNVATIREVVESERGYWVDLADGFPQDYMLDTVHLLPEGYDYAARELVADIEPIVSGLESERSGERR